MLGRPRISSVLMHAAAALVGAGQHVAAAARAKGISRGALRRWLAKTLPPLDALLAQRESGERLAEAAVFGIGEDKFDRVMAWADEGFGSAFGAWDAFFTLADARNAAHSFLKNAVDVDLWGVGLLRSLVSAFCESSAPPPQQPGCALVGASAAHIATCLRPATSPKAEWSWATKFSPLTWGAASTGYARCPPLHRPR